LGSESSGQEQNRIPLVTFSWHQRDRYYCLAPGSKALSELELLTCAAILVPVPIPIQWITTAFKRHFKMATIHDAGAQRRSMYEQTEINPCLGYAWEANTTHGASRPCLLPCACHVMMHLDRPKVAVFSASVLALSRPLPPVRCSMQCSLGILVSTSGRLVQHDNRQRSKSFAILMHPSNITSRHPDLQPVVFYRIHGQGDRFACPSSK
jgi:hypothetical protein